MTDESVPASFLGDVQVSSDTRVVIITPLGALPVDRVIQIIKAQYPNLGNRSVLWDLTLADVSSLTRSNMTEIAFAVRKISRTGSRKTGYIVSDSASYLKLCQYLNEATTARLPIEYAVFKTWDAAKKWIEQP
jgi:hypothetical protein